MVSPLLRRFLVSFNLQSAICGLQSAVCSLQSAVCSLQSAVCSLQMPYTVFSLRFNFIHATSCRLYSWLILSVQKMIYFDLLYLSFPGSLRCIVCQHYESLFVLPIFDTLFNMGARWFCLSCIRRDIRSSASSVKR